MNNDYSQEVEAVKEYYADLLILQYRNKQKARETIKIGAEIYLGDGLIFQLQDVLDIDKAEGKQLDIIGKILTCPRIIEGINPELRYFSFEKPNARGFSTKNKISDGAWKTKYNSLFSIYSMPDNYYRILLKFAAIKNRLRASMSEMDNLLFLIFGNSIYLENNKNLSITYFITDEIRVPGQAAQKLGYLAAPNGITAIFEYI